MTPAGYKDKLRNFNATTKYQRELALLYFLVEPSKGEKILDYGCGLGTAIRYFNSRGKGECLGFDVHSEYYEGEEYYFRKELFFKVDKVFFMHSFAHMKDIGHVLDKLKYEFLNPHGEIIIITPNRKWIEKINNPDYKPDPTVVSHLTLHELVGILISYGFNILECGEFGNTLGGDAQERIFVKAQLK